MRALDDFAAVRLDGWTGLPPALRTADFAAFGADPARMLAGPIGDPPQSGRWLACESSTYRGGLRIWVDGDTVLLFEGDDPVDASGEPIVAPDLGEPDALFDTVLDTLVLDGGERVYAGRGLVLCVMPDDELLLGARAFSPTSVEDYRTRLRPVLEPRRRFTSSGGAW
jgi:hypothetical protein